MNIQVITSLLDGINGLDLSKIADIIIIQLQNGKKVVRKAQDISD